MLYNVSMPKKDAKEVNVNVKVKKGNPSPKFCRDDSVILPAHGVGRVVSVRKETHQGDTVQVVEFDFPSDNMKMTIPVSQAKELGLRFLSTAKQIDYAINVLSQKVKVKRTMWNRRAAAYDAKLKSGDILSVAEVIRDLHRHDTQQEQSYSERCLYEHALQRMGQEIGAARN